MLYLARTDHEYIEKREMNLYGSRKVELPRLELYVIYTGSKEISRDTISLSEEFFGGRAANLEVTVHVLTDGKENDTNQYAAFTKIFDGQVRLHGRTPEAAATIRICRDRDILRDYLSEHEREVRTIMITLFDNDQIVDAFAKEKEAEVRAKGRVEGRAEGRAEGKAEGDRDRAIRDARNLLKTGVSAEIVAGAIGLPLSEVNALK